MSQKVRKKIHPPVCMHVRHSQYLVVCVLVLHLQAATPNPTANTLSTCLRLANLMEILFFSRANKSCHKKEFLTPTVIEIFFTSGGSLHSSGSQVSGQGFARTF